MLNLLRQLGQPIGILILFLGVQFPRQVSLANPVLSQPFVRQSANNSQFLCSADLATAIETIVKRPEFLRSRWGILIEQLNSQQILYALDEQKYFIPASNVKLLTTAAILHQLGSKFRLQTPVYGTGTPPNLAKLRIVGKGDPSLTTAKLKALAQELKRQGIRQISQLIVEDSGVNNSGINPTWEWDDLNFAYAPVVNALILNENAVTLKLFPQQLGQPLKLELSDAIAVRKWQIKNLTITAPKGTPNSLKIQRNLGESSLEITGELAIDADFDTFDLAIADPANYFLESFRGLLLESGISVRQAMVSQNHKSTNSEQELAVIESEPLSLLIKKTNQESNNLFAEALLNLLGNESIEALEKSLTQLGINPNTYHLQDGSGLSRHNLVSPESLVKTLKLMTQTPESEIYRNSLAVAGVSGTLKERFQNTPLQGNLQAKTGTLAGISALSGYLFISNYQPLVFSIIVNQSDQTNSSLRQAIDEIMVILSKVRNC